MNYPIIDNISGKIKEQRYEIRVNYGDNDNFVTGITLGNFGMHKDSYSPKHNYVLTELTTGLKYVLELHKCPYKYQAKEILKAMNELYGDIDFMELAKNEILIKNYKMFLNDLYHNVVTLKMKYSDI